VSSGAAAICITTVMADGTEETVVQVAPQPNDDQELGVIVSMKLGLEAMVRRLTPEIEARCRELGAVIGVSRHEITATQGNFAQPPIKAKGQA
jgi:hypothetical protein